MLLAADVGNTNVVFALFEGRTIKARWRIATDARRTGDQYAVWLIQLLQIEGYTREDVKQIIIGSVVPRAIHNLTVLSEKYFGIAPLIAGEGAAAWGFEVDVEQPNSLGADRALNTIAAHAKYPGDKIVVEGVNRVKKHTKIGQSARGAKTGGIITQEAPIHISNVMLVDPETNKPTRLGAREEAGEKTRADGSTFTFTAQCRIDTANEMEYYRNGGILQYVLRKLAA